VTRKRPDANHSGSWRRSDSFRRLQSVSQSIRSLEYGKMLNKVNVIWHLVPTDQGQTKPTDNPRRVREDIIVLKDSSINELIDINALCSEKEVERAGLNRRNAIYNN
jgi:hypothetical protein